MNLYVVKCRTCLAVEAQDEAEAIVKFQKSLHNGGFAFTAELIERNDDVTETTR